MSTNKSTEESEGLVPAAMAWWNSLSTDKVKEYALASLDETDESKREIPYIWMQEVVLPHFAGFAKYDKQDHNFLAELYLKEHTVKEDEDKEIEELEADLWNQPTGAPPVKEESGTTKDGVLVLPAIHATHPRCANDEQDTISQSKLIEALKENIRLKDILRAQDSVLIQKQLDALKLAKRTYELKLMHNCPEFDVIESAITKAEAFLGTKS